MTEEVANRYATRLAVFCGCLAVVYLFGHIRGCIVERNKQSTSVVSLAPTEQEKIILDPTHHSLITVTPTGTTTTTLPDRPSIITLNKDGGINVISPQYGYEQKPFVGIAYAETFRLGAGCDLFFFKRLDIGPVVTFVPEQPIITARLGIVVSYTIWSNTRLSLGFDNARQIVGAITIRL